MNVHLVVCSILSVYVNMFVQQISYSMVMLEKYIRNLCNQGEYTAPKKEQLIKHQES